MTVRFRFFIGLFALLGLCVSSAMAADIYLNGKKITGYSDVDFGKVKVTLDASGNVHIDAPDFKVQEVDPGGKTVAPAPTKPTPATPPPANPANLKEMYFIITEGSQPGGTGYDVKLMVNNRYVKTLSDTIPQHVIELNEHLKPGANTVGFLAKREGRAAKGAADTFSLMIGKGNAKGGQLNIEEVVHEFKLTGADPIEKAKTFAITAK
jgi:hypothetical protein